MSPQNRNMIWEGMWCQMNKINIFQLLDQLIHDLSEHEFKAVEFPNITGVFIAINRARLPVLLITSNDAGIPLQLKTDMLSLLLHTKGTVYSHGKLLETKKFHMLQCESSDTATVESFLILVRAFVSKLSYNNCSNNDLIEFFQTLVRLFKVSPVPDLLRERQGLWGELFLLQWVGDIKHWTKFWHSDFTLKFDFASNNKRIEVKTSMGERIHYFSHDQLFSNDKEIAIASIMLSKDDAGKSLRELINEVRTAIADEPDLIIKLENAIRKAGMQDLSENGPRFDYTEASRHIAWFWSDFVPRFNQAEPPGVSNTHYRVNLATVEQVNDDELRKWLNTW